MPYAISRNSYVPCDLISSLNFIQQSKVKHANYCLSLENLKKEQEDAIDRQIYKRSGPYFGFKQPFKYQEGKSKSFFNFRLKFLQKKQV